MTMEEDVTQIKSMLNQYMYAKGAPRYPQVYGAAVLNSTNTTVTLNPNFYYAVVFRLAGTVSNDVNMQLWVHTKQDLQPWRIPLNNTISGYKIRGIKLNQIMVETTNLSSGAIYCLWVGFDNPEEIRITTA
ncbi:MAG: hypothetical protein ABSD73_12325 [Candidatus Bathyarchaeia archaeon]|jgi:hypothetical protein